VTHAVSFVAVDSTVRSAQRDSPPARKPMSQNPLSICGKLAPASTNTTVGEQHDLHLSHG
jgi:hypothetical protein